jgi:hypothetical protein
VGHLFNSVGVCLYSHETREFWAPIIFGRLPGTFDLALLFYDNLSTTTALSITS